MVNIDKALASAVLVERLPICNLGSMTFWDIVSLYGDGFKIVGYELDEHDEKTNVKEFTFMCTREY